MPSEGPAHPSTSAPVALADIRVDVTTRLGATSPVIATGFAGLDAIFGGGLRSGMLVGVVGSAGSGRTTVALRLAYIAARSQAGVEFIARGLDDTEVVARLAARLLRQSYPSSELSYADIWSGAAFANDAVRRAVGDAVGGVFERVGQHLYLSRVSGNEPLASRLEGSAQLAARFDRSLIVIDDLEGFAAGTGSSLHSQLSEAAYALRERAERGSAVVFTILRDHAHAVLPATTAIIEVRAAGRAPDGAELLELSVTKNRLGPIGSMTVGVNFAVNEFTEA